MHVTSEKLRSTPTLSVARIVDKHLGALMQVEGTLRPGAQAQPPALLLRPLL